MNEPSASHHGGSQGGAPFRAALSPRQGTALIIPARNEASSLPAVLSRVPASVTRIVVVDNGSSDDTAAVARAGGAEVVLEPTPGYGNACLAGIAALAESPPGLVAFADADGSDGVQNLETLLAPLLDGKLDLALSRRVPVEQRALTPQQRFGNRLATVLIGIFWGHRFEDLGPMRAISWDALMRLGMADRDFGWTVEMQIKAVKLGLRVAEHPLPYYPRTAGKSKISRTVGGTLRAGGKILWVIGRELLPEWTVTAMASSRRRASPLFGAPGQPSPQRRQAPERPGS